MVSDKRKAEKLCITQPSLSYAVAQLEAAHNNRVYMSPLVHKFRDFVLSECSLN